MDGNRVSWVDKWLLRALRRVIGPAPINLCLRSADEDEASTQPPRPTVRIADKRTLFGLIADPESQFGDAYSAGRVQIDGDLVEVLQTAYRSMHGSSTLYGRCISRALSWYQQNSIHGSQKNIHQHYDLPTDFYQMWLDPHLVYTSAYYPDHAMSLADAQRAKMDLICRKVQLKAGETVVDAGCGWGALAMHMATNFGVHVKAFNISKEQLAFAREAASRQGLSTCVEFIEDDYRNIKVRADAFVSVGMLEHVGRANFIKLGNVIHRVIGDNGRGLLHFMGRNHPESLNTWIRKRIFPGGYMPTLAEAMRVLEPQDFSVLHVENLRMHYAKTIEDWLSKFDQSLEAVEFRYGPQFARMWRLYLAGSIAGFRAGTLQLFQVVFSGKNWGGAPLTWAYLHSNQARIQQEDADSWTHAMS